MTTRLRKSSKTDCRSDPSASPTGTSSLMSFPIPGGDLHPHGDRLGRMTNPDQDHRIEANHAEACDGRRGPGRYGEPDAQHLNRAEPFIDRRADEPLKPDIEVTHW